MSESYPVYALGIWFVRGDNKETLTIVGLYINTENKDKGCGNKMPTRCNR
jgi:hypothetical protein